MNAIPLEGPDGTVYAYACGRCKRVKGGFFEQTDIHSPEVVAKLAGYSREGAEGCCSCVMCGRPRPYEALGCAPCKAIVAKGEL